MLLTIDVGKGHDEALISAIGCSGSWFLAFTCVSPHNQWFPILKV